MMIGEVKKSGNNGGQQFEEFKTDPDLENTTISMEENGKAAPKAMASDTAENAQANAAKPSSFSESIG